MKNETKLQAKIARLETELKDLVDSLPITVNIPKKNEVLPKSKNDYIQKR